MLIHTDLDFSLFDRLYTNHTSNMFIDQPRMLNYWSHSIEKKAIEHGVDTPIYAGFQRLNRFEPVANQYRKIARTAPVWVFGEADQTPAVHQDAIQFVNLHPAARLTQEWFVVVNHPQYTHALIAQEITPWQSWAERQFRGVLTSDRNIIHYICQALENYVSQAPTSAF